MADAKYPQKILQTRPLAPIPSSNPPKSRERTRKPHILPKIVKPRTKREDPPSHPPQHESRIPPVLSGLFEMAHLGEIRKSLLQQSDQTVLSTHNYKQVLQYIDALLHPQSKTEVSRITMDTRDIPPATQLIPDYHQLCNLASIIKDELNLRQIDNRIFVRRVPQISTQYPYYYFANFINCRIIQPKRVPTPLSTGSQPKEERILMEEDKQPREDQQTQKSQIVPNQPKKHSTVRHKKSSPPIEVKARQESPKLAESVVNRSELSKFGMRSSSPFGQLFGTSKQSPEELTVLCSTEEQTSLSLQGLFISRMPEVGLSDRIVHLNLSYNNFEQIPSVVMDLPNLEYLSFRSNPISQIPASISQLTRLKCLDASFCRIRDISMKLYSLPTVERLWLSFNRISHLSQAISKLRNLKELHVEGNELMGLPLSMISMAIGTVNLRGNKMNRVFWRTNTRNVPNRLADYCRTRLAQEGTRTEECESCPVCERPMFGTGYRIIKYLENSLSQDKLPFALFTCSLGCHAYLE